jgi:predicted NACHT family NTPase
VKVEAKRQANHLIDQIKQTPNLLTLSTNPLLLTLIAKVHRSGNVLPQNRIGLYREICQVLLEKRTRAKGLQTQYSHEKPGILGIHYLYRGINTYP